MPFDEAMQSELYAALRTGAQQFHAELAAKTYARGLAVTKKESGETKPIPVTASPVVLDQAELDRRQAVAAHLASATLKMSGFVLASDRSELVLGAVSPLERSYVEAGFRALTLLPSTRVDFFVGGEVKALEVNATIPAMQAYSDIAANTLIEVAGRWLGLSDAEVSSLTAKNGSNTQALYRALLAGYQQVRPGKEPERVALLCWRNDAQTTELEWIRDRFREWGTDADVVYPDQLSGDDVVRAGGKAYDFVYRHLFVRRLETPGLEGAQYVKGLLAEKNGTRAVVLNRPSTQVEVKAVFALLSEALEDDALRSGAGLTDEELEAIRAYVPWTRVFRGDALKKQVIAEPERYVLKRSWDYGGRAVFLGPSRDTPGFHARVEAAYGAAMSWPVLVERAEADRTGGGYVVQEIVPTGPHTHVLCTAEAATETPLIVDFSAYASVGLDAQPRWGGVCRGSPGHIVNIVGGGGVVPLLTTEVATSLLTAARGRLDRA